MTRLPGDPSGEPPDGSDLDGYVDDADGVEAVGSDPRTDPEPTPARPWSRRARRALGLTLVCLGVAATALLATPVLAVAPYAADDLLLDRAVRVALLDWRDFGPEAGRERLLYELDHLGIGQQVGDDACIFDDAHDGKAIRCAWEVALVVPLAERAVPIRFRTDVEVDASGSLR
jgi:hypothetical protein